LVWESNQEEELMQIITDQIFDSEKEDTWAWKVDEDEVFIVRWSTYNILQNALVGENTQLFKVFWI